MQPAWVVCIYTGSLQISSTVSSLSTHSQSNVWLWKVVPAQFCNVPCRTTRWTGISHFLESRMYEVSMEWMNCIQSRKLSEYCFQLFCEWLLAVFHFSGIECTDSRNLEPRTHNSWKTSLRATQDNVQQVSSCRNRLDVLERWRWRLAHLGCKSVFCTWSKKKKIYPQQIYLQLFGYGPVRRQSWKAMLYIRLPFTVYCLVSLLN
jgi:hypothetical protein